MLIRTLSNHILKFCLHLRGLGFLIGPQETMDSIRAVETIDIFNREQFQACLRLVLCSSMEEQAIFDHAFKEFFLNIKENRVSKEMLHYLSDEEQSGRKETYAQKEELDHEKAVERKQGKAPFGKTGTTLKDNEFIGEERNLSWVASKMAFNQSNEFQAYIPPDELGDMEAAAKMFIRKIELKRAQSYQAAKKGRRLDFRRTIRGSLQTGGYPVRLYWKKRKRQGAKFVLLCDASRSMSSYAHCFLQFAYALSKYTRHVEVFLFSTKIKRVTDQLLERRIDLPVLKQLGDSWGGGTCIGESIYSFVQDYGLRLLHQDMVVLIASDGLDAGDITHITWAMGEIQRKTSAVIWLNPLLKIDGYEPTARGMKAALKYVDLFDRASDAQSFLKLAKKIKIRR
ncbi:vWA domain-containing protein [Bacillus norwichensis]|uniref:VWA domain-containing protein n=1 Tax=Bacillus norwichensis TaxID=2762217 RepID=A0ABR8VH87_9BACI|nr:VWA domain-containing protein [Bacillus norwichensis]MBD8004113.1 VWA domain-containing protein [Bacillus norwichensis]